jgi:hypothetical protein
VEARASTQSRAVQKQNVILLTNYANKISCDACLAQGADRVFDLLPCVELTSGVPPWAQTMRSIIIFKGLDDWYQYVARQ